MGSMSLVCTIQAEWKVPRPTHTHVHARPHPSLHPTCFKEQRPCFSGKSKAHRLLSLSAPLGRTQSHLDSWGNSSILFLFLRLLGVE